MQFFVKFAAMDFNGKLQLLASLIEQSDNIAIVTHEHPDGDAAGSSSALAHYLKFIGKCHISLIREDLPSTIAFIDPCSTTIRGEDAIEALKSADLIFCTDFCVFGRVGGVPPEALELSPAKKILLDHHAGAELDRFDVAFSKNDISSACEVVYQVLKGLCPQESERKRLFSGRCGYCLMSGMITDTNNFSCATFPSTFQMASELLGYGIDRDEILYNLYNTYRENRVRAMAFILSERFEIREDGLAILKVSEEDWHRFGLREGELEGLVNIPLSIDKVHVSLYLREDVDTVRVSIRAKRGYSARTMAQTYFHGGGHELASGGKLHIGADIPAFAEIDEYLKKVNI